MLENIKLHALLMGIVTGILIGFSSSPVVGGVISAVVSTAFILLSLIPNNSQISLNAKPLAAIPFFVIPLAIFAVGVAYLRSNHIILPSPIAAEFQQLRSIGFSEVEARDVIRSQKIQGQNLSQPTGTPAGSAQKIQTGVVSELVGANYEIRTNLEILQSKFPEASVSRELQNMNAQTKNIGAIVRKIMAAEIGNTAADLWFELHTLSIKNLASRERVIAAQYPEEYQKIVEFMSK